MDKLSEQEIFIENLKDIKKYWSSVKFKCQDMTTDEVIDGVIFSILVMIDGDSAATDFHRLTITNSRNGKRIDCGNLHELYRQ